MLTLINGEFTFTGTLCVWHCIICYMYTSRDTKPEVGKSKYYLHSRLNVFVLAPMLKLP